MTELPSPLDAPSPRSAQQCDLPAPLTTPNCDLRSMPSMLLDVGRLRDSELSQVAVAEVFRCGVLSWAASWHQIPAGSLPDDDRKLAHLLGYGRDVRGFRRTREKGGMRGWIRCSDGRLYHPVVCEKAIQAMKVKAVQKVRTEAATKARIETAKAARKAVPAGPMVPNDPVDGGSDTPVQTEQVVEKAQPDPTVTVVTGATVTCANLTELKETEGRKI